MIIASIRHKAVRRFFLTGDAKRLDGPIVERLRKMLAFLASADGIDELLVPPNYGLRALTGDLAGRWSMTVTRNWQLTFEKVAVDAIAELDLEDYH